MSEDKLKSADQMRIERIHELGGITKEEAQRATWDACDDVIKKLMSPLPPQRIYIKDDFRQQLASRLGRDVEMVTVENVVALVEALEKLMSLGTGYGEASDLIRIVSKPALAPFKREVR